MANFEELYDQIGDVTNDTINFVGMKLMNGASSKTAELMYELKECAIKFKNAAHELEEHLAWDN